MKTSIPKSKRPLPKSKQIGLRAKPDEKSAWERLPFVGKDHSKHFSSWDVPLTGGFFGGIEVGRVAGRMFLKYLRDERQNPCRLGSISLKSVLASMDAKVASTDEEKWSLEGHRAGFMGEISYWLESAAERLGESFDAIPMRSFVQMANEDLERTDEAFNAAINSKVSQ
ncbi:hypothetical protein SAMN05216475_6283 [Pseudomonas synxantha]|uniref:Phage protein n=1 Tax=Pseudomonas synxantha TaxID=47883 RepID=A0AAX3I1K3_9PSED|nr:hypothetical protein [Pseudomonas synxantha]KRP50261.1 hypothetical protein TU77_23470 [Pseudomonas synxantha]SDU68929.1 hypothetical protein SAMN05216475_6283 [Pseudomonas synxantha]VTQ88038.1 Uncharacterised protein [Pseudomonas synxantha]